MVVGIVKIASRFVETLVTRLYAVSPLKMPTKKAAETAEGALRASTMPAKAAGENKDFPTNAKAGPRTNIINNV